MTSEQILFNLFRFDELFFAGVVIFELQFDENVLISRVTKSYIEELIAVLLILAPVVMRHGGPIYATILDNFLLFQAVRSFVFVKLY